MADHQYMILEDNRLTPLDEITETVFDASFALNSANEVRKTSQLSCPPREILNLK